MHACTPITLTAVNLGILTEAKQILTKGYIICFFNHELHMSSHCELQLCTHSVQSGSARSHSPKNNLVQLLHADGTQFLGYTRITCIPI